MTHASVFSGIGGPEVAATMLGWENLFHCEINPFGRAVLDYWYPNSKSYEDITTTDFTEWRGRVNVLTGGFPCQPFSYAGKRGGATDDRYLWPYMFRCIDQLRPDWVVAENVAGITTMVEQGKVSEMANQATLFNEDNNLRRYQLRETFTLQRICTDLESHGYAVQPVLIPACAVGAPHRRDRVFIVAKRITADTSSSRQSAPEQQGERERTEVQQQSQEQSQYGTGRPSDARPIADTDERRSSSQGKSAEGNRPGANDIQGQTRQGERPASERTNGLSSVLRNAADTSSEGLERAGGQRVQSDEGRGCTTSDDEPSRTTDAIGESEEGEIWRTIADSYIDRMERNLWPYDGIQPQSGLSAEELTDRYGNLRSEHRWEYFPTVSPVHRGNDGVPFDVDRLTLSFGKWRTEALKAYGNAIVPQVMYEIFRAIEQVSLNIEH